MTKYVTNVFFPEENDWVELEHFSAHAACITLKSSNTMGASVCTITENGKKITAENLLEKMKIELDGRKAII